MNPGENEEEQPFNGYVERDILGQQKRPVYDPAETPEKKTNVKPAKIFSVLFVIVTMLLFLILLLCIVSPDTLFFLGMVLFGGKIGG